MIYDSGNARLLLGALAKSPSLLNSDKFPLSDEDFTEVEFHLRIFQAIKKLAKQGAKDIEPLDIYNLCDNHPEITKVFNENNLNEFLETVKELAKEDNVPLYWNEVKKNTLLRQYKNAGFGTEHLEKIINDITLDDIVKFYDSFQTAISKVYAPITSQEEYVAGTDFLKTKKQLENSPLYGASFQSLYLNDIYRGIHGFILRGAKSGYGKTTVGIGDLCQCTCKEYYDFETGAFVENKARVGASLFINTEMDLRLEIDTILIAWISGVPRNHILDGRYDYGEEERVEYAQKVLVDSELYLVDNPAFTTKTLVDTIREYARLKGVKNVFFDYIANNGFVATEIANETKIPQREDMVLLALTDRLKQVQRECNVGLISAVQTNGQEENFSTPNESCLAGGKAQIRKTDGTMIMLPPRKNELEIFETAKESPAYNIPTNAVCNNIVHIIKGRHTKYPNYIKIFQYIDYSTARTYDYFVTTKDGAPIDVKRLRIEYDGRKEV